MGYFGKKTVSKTVSENYVNYSLFLLWFCLKSKVPWRFLTQTFTKNKNFKKGIMLAIPFNYILLREFAQI